MGLLGCGVRAAPRISMSMGMPLRAGGDRLAGYATWAVIVISNVVLVVLVSRSPPYAVYDERVNLVYVELLHNLGLSASFLRELPAAAGPTFAFVYAPIMAVTGLMLPWLRFISYAVFILAMVLLWRALADRGDAVTRRNAVQLTATYTALPTVAVSAGMALTEVPALIFVVLALLVLVHLFDRRSARPPAVVALAILAGIALGLATLGRQNYLVLLPCLLALIDYRTPAAIRRDVVVILVIGFFCLLVCVPVFAVWGGLITPKLKVIGVGFAPYHGVLSAGYAGIFAALLAPRFYAPLWQRKSLLVLAVVLGLLLAALFGVDYVPARELVASVGGERLAELGEGAAPYLLSLIAAAFAVCLLDLLWRQRTDPFLRFCICVVVVLIVSNMENTAQFSSRYVFVMLPFLFLALVPLIRISGYFALRLGLGAVVGLLSLAAYF
jgi:hypothetical protein